VQTASSLARSIYRWNAFLALPGFLWAAFETYGLTLRGSQMLFFSIAHTRPLLARPGRQLARSDAEAVNKRKVVKGDAVFRAR
jgi:hypothetical protein